MWLWDWNLSNLHLLLAQWDQVIAPCQQGLAANSKLWQCHFNLAAAYGWLGREAEAKAEVAETLKLVPGLTAKGVTTYIYGFSDNSNFRRQVARMVEGWRKAAPPEE